MMKLSNFERVRKLMSDREYVRSLTIAAMQPNAKLKLEHVEVKPEIRVKMKEAMIRVLLAEKTEIEGELVSLGIAIDEPEEDLSVLASAA